MNLDIATKEDIESLAAKVDNLTSLISKLVKEDTEKLVTIKEAGKMLGCSYERIKTLCRNKHLKSAKDGKILYSSIMSYMNISILTKNA